MDKIVLQNIQDQIDKLVKGFKIVGDGDYNSVFELKFNKISSDFIEPTDVYLTTTKLNYPQPMNVKVNLKSGLVTELYPSIFHFDELGVEKSLKLLQKDNITEELNVKSKYVPYYSLNVVDYKMVPDSFYNVEDLANNEITIIKHDVGSLFYWSQYKYNEDSLSRQSSIIYKFLKQNACSYFLTGSSDRINISKIVLGYTPFLKNYNKIFKKYFVQDNRPLTQQRAVY